VRFGYRGALRTVDPWQLNFRAGFWYLSGWDHERGERRMFRIDRFSAAPVVDDGTAFARPPEASGGPGPWAPWEMGDEEPVAVTVLVDGDQARWAVDAAGEVAVRERRQDGSVVLELRVTNRAALRSFVLGMLDHGEVLAPRDERDELMAWVRASLGDST
jgi:predicted DNA-binding transcriptional regulator YafY